jgi:hypothetical protein
MPTTDDFDRRSFRVTVETSFSVTARGLWNLLDRDARRRLYGDDIARFDPAAFDANILDDGRVAEYVRATESPTDPHRPTGARRRPRRRSRKHGRPDHTPAANTAHTREEGQQP